MPLFAPFRALGYITDSTPFNVQRRGRENFVTVSVGKAWQIYNCAKLSLVFVGPQLQKTINSLAAWRDLTFAAYGSYIGVFHRAQKIATLAHHAGAKVVLLYSFGDVLVSVGADRRVLVWDAKSPKDLTAPLLEFCLPASFTPTVVTHPDTYLNKVLFGSEEGKLQLWNISSGQLVYEFAGWGSPITCLEPSPALDVVAAGCADGRLHVHNLKFDEEVMELSSAGGGRGAVTALAFRRDGQPFLAAGGTTGVITVWHLQKKKLQTIIKDAHDGAVVSLHFLASEPVLLSSGADNSLKMWIFDTDDGEARLLRFRSGHSAPPTCIGYYGSGRHILSAGQDRAFRVFSTIQDHQSRELSQRHIQRRAKKLKVREEELKLGRVVGFAAAEIRARDWCNLVTCHEGDSTAYTWRLQNYVIGEHTLEPPGGKPTPVKAVAISACGNFAVLGTAGGRIDRFNLQSGLHRGSFQVAKAQFSPAHSGAVVGLDCDGTNRRLISAGYDAAVKIWDFKSRALKSTMSVPSPIVKMVFHRGNGLAAIASDDLVLRVYDVVAARLVRAFPGHADRITDLRFSEDGRWLLSTSMDATLRTWDVVAARPLDCMRLDAPCTGLSLAPGMDMLATTHVGRNGIYLWANQLMFSLGAITEGPEAAKAGNIKSEHVVMPTISTGLVGGRAGESEAGPWESNPTTIAGVGPGGEGERAEDSMGARDGKAAPNLGGSFARNGDGLVVGAEAVSTVPLAPELVTLSMLPRSQVQNILNLEVIKVRNKPVAPPKKPERAPFFLPTVPSLSGVPKFGPATPDKAKEEEEEEQGGEGAKTRSRILAASMDDGASDFIQLLRGGAQVGDYSELLEHLRRMSPSEVDAEVRAMEVVEGEAEAREEEIADVAAVLDFLCHELAALRHFELLQAFMHLFLEVHAETISTHSELQKRSRVLLEHQEKAWRKLDDLLHSVRCMVGFLSNTQ